MKNEMDSSPKSEIILYQPNETVSLEVRLDEETCSAGFAIQQL